MLSTTELFRLLRLFDWHLRRMITPLILRLVSSLWPVSKPADSLVSPWRPFKPEPESLLRAGPCSHIGWIVSSAGLIDGRLRASNGGSRAVVRA